MFRNEKLLRLAKGAPCLLNIPNVCCGDQATTVACHSNQIIHGKGTGIKAHDCYISFGCFACHRALDQGNASAEDKLYWFQRGMEKTWLWLWENDKIAVCDAPQK